MSHVHDSLECECDCHQSNNYVVHMAPCCEPCPICHRNIKGDSLGRHMELRHALPAIEESSDQPEIISVQTLALRDMVLALLSLASQKGFAQIPLSRFYRLMAALSEQFPHSFRGVAFIGSGATLYSKEVESALDHWINFGVDIVLPDGKGCTEITRDVVADHLAYLHDEYGAPMIVALDQMADYLVKQLRL